MKRKLILGGALLVIIGAAVLVFVWPPTPGPRPLPVKKLDPWILQSNDPNDKYGTYLGNGHIGAVIGPEGVGRNGPCLMSGLYEGEALKALPIWSDFPLYDEHGRRFELDKTAPYRQTLNMREGYVETELTLKAGEQRLRGKVILFILRPEARVGPQPDSRARWEGVGTGPDIAVLQYDLTSQAAQEVRIGEVPMGQEWRRVIGGEDSPVRRYRAYTVHQRSLVLGVLINGIPGENGHGRKASARMWPDRGTRLVLTKYAGVQADALLGRRPESAARSLALALHRTLEGVRGTGFGKLLERQKRAWRNLWKSDIVIEGDPEARQAIHAMMFYLLSSASFKWSIPPTGLSSGAWQGHIFWDADTWVFPTLALQHPTLAHGVWWYRLGTLAGARENARKRGLSGAEFAWESARTGRETVGMPYSEERHVTADVAIMAAAFPQFCTWLIENELLADEVNEPLLRDTAEYWASRVTYKKVKECYEILNVVPPDENAEIVNNSAYTNAAAKRNIELAIEAARKAGRSYPRKWEEIARKMYIPFDAKNRRFLEYEGYKGQNTKQADTELLIYPLAYPMPEDVKRNTFDYYKTKTDPRGPAMTSSIHAIIAAELGRPEEAYQHFLASYKDFLRGPFLMFNEKRSKTYENMCFLTGCGGTLQSVIYGFAGLRIGRRPPGFKELLPDLYIKPCLPPKWKKLTLTNIQWRGKAYNLTILPGNKWKLEELR